MREVTERQYNIISACYTVFPGGPRNWLVERNTTMLFKTLQQTKRFLRIVLGFTLLALGAVLFFSPAPGWLVMLLGLGLLAAEFVWARRLLASMKEQSVRLRDFVLARGNARSL